MSEENVTPEGQGGAPAQGEAAPNTNQPSTGENKPWFDSFENKDLKGFVESKGFKNPEVLADSYKNLEKLLGVKEKLVQLPDEMNKENLGELYDKLGRPEKPEEYGIRPENVEEKDAAFFDWAEKTFHDLGLSRTQAEELIESYNNFVGETSKSMDAEAVQNLETQKAELQKEWGKEYTDKIAAAQTAAQKFGVNEETINQLEMVMGYKGVMDFMSRIGEGLGEHSFVSGESSKFQGSTPEQAHSELNRLMKDSDFQRRFASGDAQARQKWNELNKQAFGG